MLITILVVFVVSMSLIAGALWGLYGKLSKNTEGFLIALAGGALIVSAVLELIEPAMEDGDVLLPLLFVFIGALVFTGLDFYVKEKWSSKSGGAGLLAAITLDGLPENLALGVALISADPLAVAALSGSILLSNLPEAAGGAKEMKEDGRSKKTILILWTGTALLLSAAALIVTSF
jgi:ZIP family zinc transporter